MKIEPVISEAFKEASQDHIFKYFDSLSLTQKGCFIEDLSIVDPAKISSLYEKLVVKESALPIDLNQIKPVEAIRLPKTEEESKAWSEARVVGEQAIKAGRVAAFTVAGGQGTRLGFGGPKGMFPVTPVIEKSLFQVFAEKIKASNNKHQVTIHWFIMTSEINNDATVEFFEQKNYFGLPTGSVHFLKQGLMPAVDFNGKIMLSGKGHIALSPDGHGGSFKALLESGAIEQMEESGADIISYFQVDNPLVKCIDPTFIGFHLLNKSDISSKAVKKKSPGESLGCFCQLNGNLRLVEYSDMPKEFANMHNLEGELAFGWGNVAVHLIQRDFAKKVAMAEGDYELPYHIAKKKIQTLDDSGKIIEPQEPNGYKFEQFIFDSLLFTKKTTLLEADRYEEFAPVKNAEGNDSPQSSKDLQSKLYLKWIQKAQGLQELHFNTPIVHGVEISPLFADTEEEFKKKWDALPSKPSLDQKIYLG